MATGDGHYITILNVKAEIPDDILARLTDDDPNKNAYEKAIDVDKIAAAIRYAESRIDNAVARRYKTPIVLADLNEEAAKDAIIQAALNFVYHRLYSRVGNPQAHSDKKKMADDFLKNVSEGLVELVGAETISRTRIRFSAPAPKFGRNVPGNDDRITNP